MSKCLDCWRDVASKLFWHEEQSVKYHTKKFSPLIHKVERPSLPGKTGGEIMRWRMDDSTGVCRVLVFRGNP